MCAEWHSVTDYFCSRQRSEPEANSSLCKCGNLMWFKVHRAKFYLVEAAESHVYVHTLWLPRRLITFKVACFPSLGVPQPAMLATMSCPWPHLGQTSVDVCNPALPMCLVGLSTAPPRGRHRCRVATRTSGSPCIGPCSEMEVNTLTERTAPNQCSSEKCSFKSN